MAAAGAMQRIHLNSSLGIEPRLLDSSKRLNRLTARAGPGINPGQEDPATGSDKGDSKRSVDWDKAWSSYSSSKTQRPSFKLDMEQYVNRRPIHRDYPLTEEVDQFRKIERSTLKVWTDPKFTYAGFSVIIGMFAYMVMNGPPA